MDPGINKWYHDIVPISVKKFLKENVRMKYFILKHTDPDHMCKNDPHPPWICRVQVEDKDATILNETFESFVMSGCYGSYKAMRMTKEDFERGTLTPIHTLATLPKFIMDEVGYYPY